MWNYLDHNSLYKNSVQESEYVQLCEVKPELLFTLKRFQPIKQSKFEDPFFRSYLFSNPDESKIVPEYLWYHSAMNKEAFQKAVAKYCCDLKEPMYDDKWKTAELWLHKCFSPTCGNSSVVGIAQVLRDCSFDTSPGPLARFFEKTKADYWSSPDGRNVYNNYWESCKTPGANITLWGAHLKDELKPLEKIAANKTRLFQCAPTEHFIASQQMCLDLNQKLIKAGRFHKTPVAVGMNMYYGSYDIMGRQLSSRAHQFFADIGGFDSRFRNLLFVIIIRFRFEMYTPAERTFENLCRLCNIYRDVMYTPLVMPDGAVYIIPHQPSGQGNTAIDNSLGLFLLIAWVWLDAGGPADYSFFEEKVDLWLFGDDSAVAVDDEAFKFLNPDSMVQSFTKIQMELEFSNHWEFLGHYIAFEPRLNCYVPRYPFHKVIASLMYTGKEDIDSCVSKAMSLRTLSYGDQEAFAYVDKYCIWLLKQYPLERFQNQYLSEFEIRVLFTNISVRD